jgi:hypothetical protein
MSGDQQMNTQPQGWEVVTLDPQGVQVAATDGEFVALVSGKDATAALARAYLIAAAPDLLEALKEARDLLRERTHGNPARSAGHNARLVIEAAIAAAEGRS